MSRNIKVLHLEFTALYQAVSNDYRNKQVSIVHADDLLCETLITCRPAIMFLSSIIYCIF